MATVRAAIFGVLLKRLRRTAGLTQEALAERSSFSVGYIGMLERGVRAPLAATAELLADALRLEAGDRTMLLAAACPPTRPPGVTPASPQYAAPLVGRERERDLLGQRLRGEGPPVVMLAGEPGIGKTRLLRDVVARARETGWSVVEGGCQRRKGQEPYAPILAALEGWMARQSRAQLRAQLDGCGWLVRLLPELAQTTLVPAPEWTLPPDQERRLMFRAARRFLANIAGPAGTLLVLDDLQWAGADAVDLLLSLVQPRDGESPVRVVGAFRDTEVAAGDALAVALGDLSRDGLAELLSLGALAAGEARALVISLLDEGSGDEAAVECVLRLAGGVPLFLVSCALASKAGVVGPDEGNGIPWDVTQSIRQRVTAMPEHGRQLLGMAAVIGRRAPRKLLLAACGSLGRGEREVLQAVDEARRARLLIEVGDDGYELAHDLIREVLLSDLGAAWRAALHRHVADALEREPGSPPERLALHYARAGDAARAAIYLERAGDRAAVLYAHAEAAEHYRELVALLEELGREAEAARAREKLAAALLSQGQHERALEAQEPARETYRRGGDREGEARTLARAGRIYAARGIRTEGLAQVQSRMTALVAQGLSESAQADLYLALAELFHRDGRLEDLLAAAEQAARRARAAGEQPVVIHAERLRGLALLALARHEEAQATLEMTVKLAETASDWWQLSHALISLGLAQRTRGELHSARACFERAREAAERIGVPATIGYVTFLHGELVYLMGEWELALADFERAGAILQAAGPSWASLYPALGLGLLCLAQGTSDEAHRRMDDEVMGPAERAGNLYVLRWAAPNVAERDLLEGHPAMARDRIEPWLDAPGQEEGDVTAMLPFLAWAYLNLGDQSRAEALVAASVRRATRAQNDNALVDALRVQGIVATRADRFAQAEEALTRAIALGERMPYPHTVMKCLYAYGQLEITRGHPEQAHERLEAALAICSRLGERLFREQIERALAEMD